jgi:hypothetical protein
MRLRPCSSARCARQNATQPHAAQSGIRLTCHARRAASSPTRRSLRLRDHKPRELHSAGTPCSYRWSRHPGRRRSAIARRRSGTILRSWASIPHGSIIGCVRPSSRGTSVIATVIARKWLRSATPIQVRHGPLRPVRKDNALNRRRACAALRERRTRSADFPPRARHGCRNPTTRRRPATRSHGPPRDRRRGLRS